MRVLRFVTVAVSVMVFASLASVVPGGSTPVAHAAGTDLLVGDSVMAGMGSTARSVLPHHVFDAKVCRRLVSTSCSYRGTRPATALDVIRAYRGTTGRAIVIAAGYNDGTIASAVDAVVDEARRQDVPHVVWLTYRVAGRNASIYRSHNAVLVQKAQQYPELVLADWAGYSAGRSDWVAADGLHLNGSGAAAMANLLAAVLADLRPPLAPGATVCFPVAGTPGDVALVNLTPVQARGRGYGVLTASTVEERPNASNVNYGPGTVDPNIAVAPIGPDGEVCYRNADRAWVHLVADHLATIRSGSFTPPTAVGTPARVLDTRPLRAPIGAGERRCFAVAGSPGDVALVNLTPVGATGAGHGILLASDVTAPTDGSNVNYVPGTVDPNVALAPIGPDGEVCYRNATRASTHLVADHLGTIAAADVTLATATGGPHRAIDTRTDDTRTDDTQAGARIAAGGRLCFTVAGAPGDVAIVNLTPVQATGPGNGLLVGGDTTARTEASNVNYAPGTVDPNLGIAAVGSNGEVCFENAGRAAVHLVADHLVTLDAGAVVLAGPTRTLDTRTR